MGPEGSLQCSQEPATGPYPEPDEFSLYHLCLGISSGLSLSGFPIETIRLDRSNHIAYNPEPAQFRPSQPISVKCISGIFSQPRKSQEPLQDVSQAGPSTTVRVPIRIVSSAHFNLFDLPKVSTWINREHPFTFHFSNIF
jgi:hypothetical protein